MENFKSLLCWVKATAFFHKDVTLELNGFQQGDTSRFHLP